MGTDTIQLLGVIGLIFSFLCLFPTPPPPPGVGLDPSWVIALNLAHAKRLIFGPEVVITYGPLSYLMLPNFPQAELWPVWTYHIGMFVLWIQAVIRLQRTIRPLGLGLLIAIWLNVVGIVVAQSQPERLAVTIGVLSILILARLPKRSYVDIIILGILTGSLLLIKFNLGILAVSLYECLILGNCYPQRLKSPMYSLTLSAYLALPLSCCLVIYVALFGTVSSFAAFIRYSLEIASGYSDAMSDPGPAWQLALALGSMLGLMAAVVVGCRKSRQLMIASVTSAVYIFFTFKSAVVRQDSLHASTFEFYVSIATIFALVCVTRMRERLVLCLLAGLFGGLGFATIGLTNPKQWVPLLERLRGEHAMEYLSDFANFQRHANFVEAQEAKLLVPQRLPKAIREIIGSDTMDVFTYNVDRAASNSFNWDPRPVFQSYSAYTPALDQPNAGHFAGRARPRKILWEWLPIDGRYLPADEPLVFSNLLNHYDIVFQTCDLVVMSSRKTDRFASPARLEETLAIINEPFDVPQVEWNELAILRADVRASFLGNLWSFVFRGAPMFIEAKLASGSRVRGRVVWRNLDEGLIASDWFRGLPDLQPVMDGEREGAADRIVSMRLIAHQARFFHSRIRLKWSKVKITTGLADTHGFNPSHGRCVE